MKPETWLNGGLTHHVYYTKEWSNTLLAVPDTGSVLQQRQGHVKECGILPKYLYND